MLTRLKQELRQFNWPLKPPICVLVHVSQVVQKVYLLLGTRGRLDPVSASMKNWTL